MSYSTQSISPQKRQAVWDKSAGHCWYCGVQTIWVTQTMLESTESFTTQFCIDHIQAWARNGNNDLANLAPCCRSCNSKKRLKGLDAYRLWIAQQGLPIFNAEHIAYMQQLGIHLPAGFPCYPVITFWFEQEGLQA